MRTYIETIELAQRIHDNYPGAWSHSFICERNDILDAFDMTFDAFPNAKVTIHYSDVNYWIVIDFKNGGNK